MTLASRLTALVQAIGADVKQLNEVAMLRAVDAASTGNVNIASAPSTTAFDDETGAGWMTGRVLLHKQTNPIENGIWLYIQQGAPMVRAEDVLKIKTGQMVYVRIGKTYGGTLFASTKNVTGPNQEWGFAPLPKQNSIAEPCIKVYTAQQSLTDVVLDGSFSGKRVLLTAQTNKQENGVYVYDANNEMVVRVSGEIYTPGRLFPVVTQSALDLDVDWANPEIWACTEIGGTEGYTFAKTGGSVLVDSGVAFGVGRATGGVTTPWIGSGANKLNLTAISAAGGLTLANNEITVPRSGWYEVSGIAAFGVSGTGHRTLAIRRNNVEEVYRQIPSSGTSYTVLDVDLVVFCNAGDKLSLTGSHNTGGSLGVDWAALSVTQQAVTGGTSSAHVVGDKSLKAVLTANVNPASPGAVIFNSVERGVDWLDEATGRITPKVPGLYQVRCSLVPLNNSTGVGQYWEVDLKKNNNLIDVKWAYAIAAGYRFPIVAEATAEMNGTTDFFVAERLSNYGNTTVQALSYYTYLEVTYLGPLT